MAIPHVYDLNTPIIMAFNKPIKPVTQNREIELRALQGFLKWQEAKESSDNTEIQIDRFLLSMGYNLQECNQAKRIRRMSNDR